MSRRRTFADADRAAPAQHAVGTEPTAPSFGRRSLPPALRAGAAAWTWFGVAIAVAGFVLIAVGWGQVAGETHVYLQLPYVVSASLVGLALVMAGLAVLNIVARQRDGTDRDLQISELLATLEELKEAIQDRGDR